MDHKRYAPRLIVELIYVKVLEITQNLLPKRTDKNSFYVLAGFHLENCLLEVL